MCLSRTSGVDGSVAGPGLTGAGAGVGQEAGETIGRAMRRIRSPTRFMRATWILPMRIHFFLFPIYGAAGSHETDPVQTVKSRGTPR